MRKIYSMDKEWKFHMGDIPVSLNVSHQESYLASKAGGARGAASYSFNDMDWEDVDVPHDWSVYTDFDKENMLSQGYKKRGIGWYRKTFYLDKELDGKQLLLVFEGVSTACTVYFNGSVAGRNYSGYTEFTVDISDRAYFGTKPNVLSVRVDADAFEGWWYEGAGIYRHVNLIVKEPLHIAHNGIFAKPSHEGGGRWKISAVAEVENSAYENSEFELVNAIVYDRKEICSQKSSGFIAGDSVKTLEQELFLQDPLLWDLDNPNLYTLESRLYVNGKLADLVKTDFGCRTIKFDAEKGFFLNGKNVKIKGTCNHQDHAGVGVAVPDSIQEYRIRRLKEMGCNAYRCSHGNPAKEILDACDRYGMLVLDENRNFESSPEVLEQVRTMVKRDRNHPCVIMYSLFNEEPLQSSPEGRKMLLKMSSTLKKLDDTRPMLGAMNGGVLEEDGTATAMDVTGINYNISVYDDFHKMYPNQPLIGSENNSAFSTRGCYETDYEKHVTDNYDEQKAAWGQGIRETWEAVAKRDFVSGIFVWTGFDYRGEPTPFEWPSISTQFGIMDTCGIAKDAFYFHKACWTDEPMIHILPHWNWEKGKKVRVMTVTNCDEAEIFLNGKSLGRKPSNIFTQCEWLVDYEAGILSAKGYKNGECVAFAEVKTSKKPVALKIVPDRNYILADGVDTIPVNICAVDEDGTIVPDASNFIKFKAHGDCRVIGVGNGDPNCHEADYLPERSLFAGWCQCLLQSNPNAKTVKLEVDSDGLSGASFEFEVRRPEKEIAYIYSVKKVEIDGWKMSVSPYAEKPDYKLKLADNDMNSFEPVKFGNSFQKNFTSGYMLYKTAFNFPESGDYILEFQKLNADEAEIYLDDECIYSRYSSFSERVDIPVTENMRGRKEITVLLKANRWEAFSGISGGVSIRL
ncbi:MAG: glycoside hydrolase family 2 protein [Oscillospiraceae bacterium]|jgi:beta-galactosidase|nr:glycoside hydrolase family 2 protein [Oscillospiraceae bacterium]